MRDRTEVLEAAKHNVCNNLVNPRNLNAIFPESFRQVVYQPISLDDFQSIRNFPAHHRALHIDRFTQLAEIELNQALQAERMRPLIAKHPAINIAVEAYESGYMDYLTPTMRDPKVQVTYTNSFIEVKMDTSRKNSKNTGDKLHVSIDDRDPVNVEKAWGIIAQLAEKYGIDGYKILSRASSDDEKGRQFTIYLHDKTPAESQQFINALEYYFTQEQIRPDPRGMPDDCPSIGRSRYTSFRNDHFEFDANNDHYIPDAPPGYLARDVIDCAKMVLSVNGQALHADDSIDDAIEQFRLQVNAVNIDDDAIERFRQQVKEVLAHVVQLKQQGYTVAWHDVMRQSQLGQMSIGLSADIVRDYKQEVEQQMQDLLACRSSMTTHTFEHHKRLCEQKLDRATIDLNRIRQQDMKRNLQALPDAELQRTIEARQQRVLPVGRGALSPKQQLEERVELAKRVNEQANRGPHY